MFFSFILFNSLTKIIGYSESTRNHTSCDNLRLQNNKTSNTLIKDTIIDKEG